MLTQHHPKIFPFPCACRCKIQGYAIISDIMPWTFEQLAKNPVSTIATILVLLFFIGGAVNHSFAFGGFNDTNKTQLWHGFYLAVSISCIFSVLYAKDWSYWWLITLFLWQIPVETIGAIRSVTSSSPNVNQLIEPGLNAVALLCVFLSRGRFSL